MYWKEKYKTRTVKGYEGSDTIYNNEPRVEFDELVDYMERFTELYKKVRDEHPSLREAICFDAQYPLMMLNIMPNDKFVGRADIFPLGFNAQYINNEWGFALDNEWFNEQIQNEQIPQSQRDRLAALKEFWKDETSNGRFTKNMDPVHYEFLWSGGPKAPEDSFETKPQAGFCGSRVAGKLQPETIFFCSLRRVGGDGGEIKISFFHNKKAHAGKRTQANSSACFRFRQKQHRPGGSLAYPETRLHSDRLAGHRTHFQRPDVYM